MNQNKVFTAINNNDLQLLQSLYRENKENLNVRNNYGYTPLIQATLWQREDMVKFLVNEAKVNVSERDNLDKSALSRAIDYSNIPIIRILIEGGENPNGIYAPGMLYFDKILWNEQKDIIKLFIFETSFNKNENLWYNRSPLQCAISLNKIEIVKLLLDANLLIDTKSQPFHKTLEIAKDNIEIMRLLLKQRGYLRSTAFHILDKIFPSDIAEHITWMI
jgi:ankyrin repeat protein